MELTMNSSLQNFSTESNISLHNEINEFEHVSMYTLVYVTVINIIIFCVGIYGNSLVIIVMCKMRSMRTSTNYYLFSLAIADVCVLIICQPVALMELFSKERWFIGPVLCKVVPLLENGVLHASILTMIAMTVERFYCINYPFRNLTNCSETSTVRIICALWTIAFILTSPFLLITTLEEAIFFDGTSVHVCRTHVYLLWHKLFIVTNNAAFFFIPLVVITFMYSKIIKKLMSDRLSVIMRNDRNARITLRSRRQVVRTLIFIIILFFVSMCPIRVVSLWKIFTPVEQQESIGIEAYYNIMWFARLMMYLNSAGNPVIYSLSSTKFKIAFRRVLSQCAPCNLIQRPSPPTTTKILYRAAKKKEDDFSYELEGIKGQEGGKESARDNKEYNRNDCMCLNKAQQEPKLFVTIRLFQSSFNRHS